MTTFKVGDKINSPKYGKGRIVYDANDGLPFAVQFSAPHSDLHNCDGHTKPGRGKWYHRDGSFSGDQLTLRPSKWHPASEPPETRRNVRVKLDDGREWFGWYGTEAEMWHVMADSVDPSRLQDDDYVGGLGKGKVIAWRELKRKPAAPTFAVGDKVIMRGTVERVCRDGNLVWFMNKRGSGGWVRSISIEHAEEP